MDDSNNTSIVSSDSKSEDSGLQYMMPAWYPATPTMSYASQRNRKPRTRPSRSLPREIGFHLQRLFNIAVLVGILYVGFVFVSSVRTDIENKAERASSELLKEIELCAKDYLSNRCEQPSRPPAMEEVCRTWENCMKRDPMAVARSRISAETIAEVLNSFVEPLSLKTIVFLVASVVGFLSVSNLAFHYACNSGSSQERAKVHQRETPDNDDDEVLTMIPLQEEKKKTRKPAPMQSPAIQYAPMMYPPQAFFSPVPKRSKPKNL